MRFLIEVMAEHITPIYSVVTIEAETEADAIKAAFEKSKKFGHKNQSCKSANESLLEDAGLVF
jgi:hypothetical protein